jgi:ribonuclease D
LDLCQELLGVKISKQQQSSDWGADTLNKNQLQYAAQDVKYLHQLRDKLIVLLNREGRLEIADECFNFLPTKTKLDLLGWIDLDIFAHH